MDSLQIFRRCETAFSNGKNNINSFELLAAGILASPIFPFLICLNLTRTATINLGKATLPRHPENPFTAGIDTPFNFNSMIEYLNYSYQYGILQYHQFT